MLRDKLLLLICFLLLTDLLIDPVASRGKGKKRNRKGNKRRNRNRTAASTRPPPPSSPAIQPRSVSGFFANFFGDILPTTGSITIPGTDTALTWNLPTGEISTEMVATGGGVFPPTGVLTTDEEEIDYELFEREWRGKGSFTGDVRIHCLESGCSRGVVQIYNREERSWGNVCSGGWGKQESKLVCKYLQFTGKARTRRMKVSRAPRVVKKAANAWDNIDCSGREQSFAECKGTIMQKGQECRSGYYAFVQCQGGRVIEQAEVECDTSTSVRCGNRQKCIKTNYVCDGMSDCPWGTDEEECTVSESCPENNFDCGHANGGCISNSFRCDGENDCVNGIDENQCKDYLSYYRQFRNSKIRATNFESGWRYVTPYVCAKKCREEKRFRCAAFNYNKATKECDLTSSTRNGLGITPALATTTEWDFYELRNLNCDEFRCRSGVCLSNALVCNGENDCEGGEDEVDCEDHNLYPEIIFGRLGGEANPLLAQFEGHLEVSTDEDFTSSFGLVCDIGWGMNEANVACRQLGFRQGALQALHGNYFRRTKLPYKLNNVKCRGTERSLAECNHNGWNNATCPMDHEAGVICISNDVTLTTDPRPTSPPVVTTTEPTSRPRPNPSTPAPTSQPSSAQCGVKPLVVSTRIVGGNAVEPNSWPWQAGLWILGTFKCGGTLIAPCWVLTAAHCIDHALHLKHKTVILGDHRTRESEVTEQQFRVKRIIVHPYYDADRSNRDIALIRLEEKNGKCAVINEQVKPACLPTSPTQFSGGHNCWITGWGQTSFNSRIPYQNELREARVPLITTEDCRSRSKYGNQLTDDMICAGYLRGGVDTCQGDSGGPLVCGVGDTYTIWGVTSFGNGCAMAYYPGIYTKVVNFLDWINQYINE